MINLYRDIYENEISILEEEFMSVNNNNNNLSLSMSNEYESVSTITSIVTPYTESVVSEKSSENTLSSSGLQKIQFCPLEQSSTFGKSSDPETVISEQNSENTLSSSGLQNIQFALTTISETMPKEKLIDADGWKAISEYEDFWNAWENGQDIEKIDISINKIQDVFEKVHLPEPPLPTKQTETDAIPVENNNSKARLPEPTPAKPSLSNVLLGILREDVNTDQFQDDISDDEVSPDSTVQEFDEDVLTQASDNSYIDDIAAGEFSNEFDEFDYDCDYDED